jgi:hypothetical protein
MADKKISALTGATTPLAGTEVLPIVQGGSTVKVSIANVTAGRAVSTGALSVTTADITLDNAYALKGKLVAGTAVAMIKRSSADEVTIDEDGYGAKIGFGGRYNFAGGGDFTVGVGNVVIGTAAKGIDFSANTGTAGMTSELLNWYEEGTFTPVWNGGSITVGLSKYTRIGRNVVWIFDITFDASVVVATSTLTLPFPCVDNWGAGSVNFTDVGATLFVNLEGVSDTLQFRLTANAASTSVADLATKRVVGMAVYNA